MRYEPGVVVKILNLARRQPYLSQAPDPELVNQLNTRNRMAATINDLNTAVEKTMVSTQAYFYCARADECSGEEREALADPALARMFGRIGVGERFGVCYAKRLSKRIRTVIV